MSIKKYKNCHNHNDTNPPNFLGDIREPSILDTFILHGPLSGWTGYLEIVSSRVGLQKLQFRLV